MVQNITKTAWASTELAFRHGAFYPRGHDGHARSAGSPNLHACDSRYPSRTISASPVSPYRVSRSLSERIRKKSSKVLGPPNLAPDRHENAEALDADHYCCDVCCCRIRIRYQLNYTSSASASCGAQNWQDRRRWRGSTGEMVFAANAPMRASAMGRVCAIPMRARRKHCAALD
jgi:hypothetical protein